MDHILVYILYCLIIVYLLCFWFYIRKRSKEIDKIYHVIDITKTMSLQEWDRIIKNNEYENIVLKTGIEIFKRSCTQEEHDEQELVDFLREYRDFLDWKNVCKSVVLTTRILEEFKDKLDWENVATYQ